MANISLDYKYYLTNVKWTNEYKNVLCFANKTARDTYFDLANIFSGITDTVNFNITNLYKTTIVIDTADYITALQSNYIIINDSVKNAYYFYFITNARQTSFNRIELNIELDVFQQYWYDTTFVDSNIRRCKYKLNKFRTGSPNKWYLNNTDSLSYLSEPFEFETVYNKSQDFENINKLDTLVYGWAYVFVDPSHDFALKNMAGTDTPDSFIGYASSPQNSSTEGVLNNIGVMCFPIYKGTGEILIYDSTNNATFTLTDAATIIDKLKEGNGGSDAAYIYSIKISRRCPFRSVAQFTASGSDLRGTFYSYDAGAFRYIYSFYDYDSVYATALFKSGSYVGMRFVCDTNDYYTYRSNVQDLINASSVDLPYSPELKLKTAQFMPTYVDMGDGNKIELDLTKAYSLSDIYLFMYYREPITPDITRYTIAFGNSAWYNGTNNDANKYSNMSFTADMSMIFTLDQWAQYLANNKNFYEQGKFNTLISLSKNYLGGAISAGQRDFVGAGTSLIGGVLDSYAFVKNRDYQVDNKKAAVDTVVNQNGSAIANLLIKGINPSIVIYSIRSDDAARAIKYMKMYGVNTNGYIANVKTTDLLSSKNFSYAYMQADVNEISSGTMSLEVEKRLLKIFNDGVRLWFDPDTMYDFNS